MGKNEKKYDLTAKLAICKKMGIDYISTDSNIPLEIQRQNIEDIINRILNNPKLLEYLDNIKDEFWDNAKKTGIIMYTEMIPTFSDEPEYLVGKKQFCKNEKFMTASGKIINIEEGQEIPVLAFQKKKIIELNKIY